MNINRTTKKQINQICKLIANLETNEGGNSIPYMNQLIFSRYQTNKLIYSYPQVN